MQPFTHQTAPGASLAGLPAGLLALVVVAGSAGLFATFWDDAWHTDLGRDQAIIPPHLLYASMAAIGAVVAAWGLPAGRTQGARLPGSEVAAGIVLYALGALLLALIVRQVRALHARGRLLHRRPDSQVGHACRPMNRTRKGTSATWPARRRAGTGLSPPAARPCQSAPTAGRRPAGAAGAGRRSARPFGRSATPSRSPAIFR